MKHNVYFAASIREDGEDAPVYEEFAGHIASRGVHVFAEHFDPDSSLTDGQVMTPAEIHHRDMAWIEQSSAVVAEVSVPSLSTGYELGRIADMYKPALALYAKNASVKELSAMIEGAPHIMPLPYERTRKGILIAKTAIDVFLHDVFYGTPRLNDRKSDFYADIVKTMR